MPQSCVASVGCHMHKHPWLRRIALVFLILLSGFGLLFGGAHVYMRWKYPYGWSHCCDKGLMLSLYQYAEDHGGAYPAGEATPEASLSLLYPKYADANLLRGKIVPEDVVQAVLDRGERLGPDTCGWHYVEGLRRDDDPRLAIVWDKVGLGHNGERNSDGGRTVQFVHFHEYIPGAKWAEFVREQERLLAERKQPE